MNLKVTCQQSVTQKKTRGGKLTKQEKQSNRPLACRRVVIGHISRRLKVFRILSQRYRNRRRRFGLRCNLMAGIYIAILN